MITVLYGPRAGVRCVWGKIDDSERGFTHVITFNSHNDALMHFESLPQDSAFARAVLPNLRRLSPPDDDSGVITKPCRPVKMRIPTVTKIEAVKDGNTWAFLVETNAVSVSFMETGFANATEARNVANILIGEMIAALYVREGLPS